MRNLTNRRAVRRGLMRQRAFSLVEIMVVVVIIGILAGVVAVNVMDSQEKANVAAARMEMDNFEKALDLYKLDNRRYPDSMDQLLGKYLRGVQKVPNDPWGNPYAYLINDGDTDRPFTIKSYGADSKEGGDNYNADITNWDVN